MVCMRDTLVACLFVSGNTHATTLTVRFNWGKLRQGDNKEGE